ncbi:hypothetical protein CRG98_039069, partial [Punica granatum]
MAVVYGWTALGTLPPRHGGECSGIVAISVFRECTPKIHREALATTETSFEEPRRVPKGRLRLVPRPRWSLSAYRPVLGCRLLVNGSASRSPVRKGVRERSEASQLKRDRSKQCEYHQGAPGHTLNNCWKLRERIQEMIDAKELTFNAVRSPNVQANPLPDHGPTQGPSINMVGICVVGEGESERGDPSPFVIEYVPTEATVGFAGIGAPPAPFVINIPVREPYSDDRFNVMGVTRSGRLYENPATTDKGKAPVAEVEAMPRAPPTPPKKVTEEEAEAFMKIIRASEYKVVEQMAKSPAHISLLALLLNSKPHREALLRVLTAAQVPKGMPPDRIEETINSIFSNTISLLLGRPWIHSAGAILSSLHQKLKFIVEERIITVKGEEDYAIYKETAVPYISVGNDENLPFHSFETISVIRDYGEVGPSRADCMIGKVLLRHNYIPGTGLGPGPIYFGEGLDEDSLVPEMEESLRRLKGRQLTSLEPTEEINVGTEEEPCFLKIGTSLDLTQRARMIDFLT